MTGGLSGPARPAEGVPEETEKAAGGGESAAGAPEQETEADPSDSIPTAGAGAAPTLALPGIADGAARVEAARRLAPRERLAGVLVADGRAVGLDLPSLAEKEIVAPWRAALPGGALYVRCVDRSEPLPAAHAQRLARVGELWVDGALPPPDELLDHLVAGVHRFVVWLGEVDDPEELLVELGDAAALGWSGMSPWEDALRLATLHSIPVIASADPPSHQGADVYRVELPEKGAFEVRLVPREETPAADRSPTEPDPASADAPAAETNAPERPSP